MVSTALHFVRKKYLADSDVTTFFSSFCLLRLSFLLPLLVISVFQLMILFPFLLSFPSTSVSVIFLLASPSYFLCNLLSLSTPGSCNFYSHFCLPGAVFHKKWFFHLKSSSGKLDFSSVITFFFLFMRAHGKF